MNSMNAITARHQLELLQRSAYDTAARGMEVIRAIDQHVDILTWIADKARADSKFVHAEIERLANTEPVSKIDEDDAIADLIQSTQDHIQSAHNLFAKRRDAAVFDKNVRHSDGLLHAYTDAMESMADLHDAIGELRWVMMAHDATIDTPSGEPTSDIDALFARILA